MDHVMAAALASRDESLWDCAGVSPRLMMASAGTAVDFYRVEPMAQVLRSSLTSDSEATVKLKLLMMDMWGQGYRVGRAHQVDAGAPADLPDPVRVAQYWWLLQPGQQWPDRVTALDELADQAERLGFGEFARLLRAGAVTA